MEINKRHSQTWGNKETEHSEAHEAHNCQVLAGINLQEYKADAHINTTGNYEHVLEIIYELWWGQKKTRLNKINLVRPTQKKMARSFMINGSKGNAVSVLSLNLSLQKVDTLTLESNRKKVTTCEHVGNTERAMKSILKKKKAKRKKVTPLPSD